MKTSTIALLFFLIGLSKPALSTGWEMVNPNVDIKNIVVIDNTWFGIQRIQQGTIVQNLLVSSVDKGYTWQSNSYFNELYTIAAYKNKLMVYADRPTERGFYLSTNKGGTWKKMVGTFNNGASSAFMTDTSIFITIQKNPGITSPVYRSTNGGDSFQAMTMDVGTSSFNFGRSYGNMAMHNGILYVFVGRVGVFSSDNDGNTWTKINNGLPITEANQSEYSSGILSQTGPDMFLYLIDGNSETKTYIFKNKSWELYTANRYAYSSYSNSYVMEGSLSPTPTAYREPYLFTVDGAYTNSSGIHYSVDKGKSWYYFDDVVIGAVSWNGIVIDGNYVYAASSLGFCRRKLSEAKNYFVSISRTEYNRKFPGSPEEFKSLLNLIGAEAMEEFLAQSGADIDGIYNSEIKDFLSDYSGSNGGGLFGNSQPGSCSYMGMPSWSANLANLKLFVRDVLFRKQGKGPEVQLAMNYLNKSVTNDGAFGKRWRFDYESSLTKRTSSVILSTGTGANFVFSNNVAIPSNTNPFTLPCLNNANLQLSWDGVHWIMTKIKSGEKQQFNQVNDSVFVLKEIADSYNNKTTIAHDAQGLISSITDASNRQYAFFNSSGHCDSIVSPDGRKARFIYNNNLLVSASDFDNVETIYSYNGSEDVSSVNIAGKTTAFEYSYSDDTLGMLSAVVDPENRRIVYESSFINDSTTLVSAFFPGSKMNTFTITNGQVTASTNGSGEEKNIFYNNQGQIDSLVYYDGSKVTFTYNANNNLIARKTRNNTNYIYQYDGSNNLTREIKLPADTIFTKTYNQKNQLTSIAFPGNRITTIAYDSNGALSGFTSPDGGNHTFLRDNFGNIASYTNPLNQTTTIQYNATGFMPISRNDFKGNSYGMEYDGNGRLKKINLPDGNSKTMNYDCCTQTGVTDENGKTISVTRDATNRILAYHYAEGWSYTTDYDSEGYISGFTNKYGMKTSLKYNQRGQITTVSDEEGDVLFDYNNSGSPIRITDKKGNTTQFRYNENGKKSEIIDASGAKVQLEYDLSNKLSATTNARGQKSELIYNSLGLVSEKKALGNSVASYNYNSNALLASFTDADGTTYYERNAAGFVTKITYPNSIVVSFTYDANGNLLTTIYPNGLTVTNQCNALNRINKVSWGTHFVDFTYNAAGYMLSETRSNNTTTSYTYNNDNLPTNIDHKLNNNSFTSETITISAGVTTGLTTKNAVELTTLPQQILGAVTNKLNQLTTTFDGYSFVYDADGNMTSASKSGTQLLSASYNANNRVSSLAADNQTYQITYDGMLHPRIIVNQGATQKMYYDHRGRLLFETDAAGNVLKSYIYKGKRLIAMHNSQNLPSFYHSNRLGHILAITSASGTVTHAYVYSASGEILGQTETEPNRFTFLGAFGAIKLSNNFILTGARVYHTVTGRYIQRDPMGMITGTNPYLYAGNNPVNGIDPLGFENTNATVNSLDFDPPSDNNYGNAAGTANPYADNLPARTNNWDTYGSAAMNTLVDISNHPISDLLPSGIASPISVLKAIDKVADKEYGGALWQFVPFNNSLEAIGTYIMDDAKKFNPGNSSGLGIIPFDNRQTSTCDL